MKREHPDDDISNKKPKVEPPKPIEDPEFDMFSDEVPDVPVQTTQIHKIGYHDMWDDSEGYLIFTPGEILNDSYKTIGVLGKGVFSNVFQGEDVQNSDQVAIKILRNNDVMRQSGQKEVDYLKKLAESDPNNEHHILRLRSSFDYKGHLCIVFDAEWMNLRTLLNSFGKEKGESIGLNLDAVRIYTYQMLLSLILLKKNKIIHSDIKPDNILINKKKNNLKLSDFGSVIERSDVVNMRTPMIQSRYYRAPEIALGLEFDYQIDLWSIACTCFELFTGKILFESKSNNHMLFLHMELKGNFSSKVLKKAVFRDQYFDKNDDFLYEDFDEVTQKEYYHKVSIKKKELKDLFPLDHGEEKEKFNQFVDFLEKCLILDPTKRLTCEQAIQHPFISA